MKMAKTIKKAVFPVAGLGTRFLPATKVNPKEILPIVDKPLIQYATEEAIHSGIKQLIFVIGKRKDTIKNYFSKSPELEKELLNKKKQSLLKTITKIVPKNINCVFVRQNKPAGLGHAINCAREIIQDEDFAVILADDLIKSKIPCLKQMINKYSETKRNIVAIEHIERKDTKKYGIVDPVNEKTLKNFYKIRSIIEKPTPSKAKSNLAVVGRYILSSKIFKFINKSRPTVGNEIQITDAIERLLNDGEGVYGYEFEGKRFDCGSKIGYLKATVEYALSHDEVSSEFRKYLKKYRLK